MNPRHHVVALGVLLICVFGVIHSANALPTIIEVRLYSAGPQIEDIHEPGHSADSYVTVYMGPYGLKVPKTDPLVSYWMCFDASANIQMNQIWKALVTDTVGAAGFYPSDADAVAKLQMVAWLSTQADTTTPPTTLKNANINKAMWEIMADYDGTKLLASLDVNGGSLSTRGKFYLESGDGDIGSVDSWLSQAYIHRDFSTPELFLIPILRNSDGTYRLNTSVQPFVADPVVPEPATLLLLGSGLAGLAGFGVKRHRQK